MTEPPRQTGGSRQRPPRVGDDVVQWARDLREHHGYTFKQVAETIGQPYETVRKWLRYTRRPFLRKNYHRP